MGDTYRPPEKRRRSDSSPNNDAPRYKSFKDVQRYSSADRPSGSRSSSRGYGRDAMSRDRSHSPKGPNRVHVASTITTATTTTTTNGIDEVLRKFVQASRQVSAASARHDLALQRAESARREHDNMRNRFTSYPAIAEQKRNHVEITNKEVQDTKDTLELLEFALSKALVGIITTANDQTKPTESSSLSSSSSSLEQDRALRASYEKVVSELDETKSRCKRLEEQMEALHKAMGKQDHEKNFIFEDLTAIKKDVSAVKGEVGVARENRKRIEKLQLDVEKQDRHLGGHNTKLELHDNDIAVLQKDGQGHTAELERQKTAVEKLNTSRRESPEQKTAQSKTNTALRELTERLDDLEAKNKENSMNINNEFGKHGRRFESLSATVAKKLDAPSTTSLPDSAMQGEINAIKSTIQVLQGRTSNQENEAAIAALGQRVLVVENDVSSKAQSQAMQRDIEAIRSTIQELQGQERAVNLDNATIDALGRRLLAVEDDAFSKTQASTMQNEVVAIKTSLQELERQLGKKENKTDIATLWQRLLAVESLASSQRQLPIPAMQSQIEEIRAEIQELKQQPSPSSKDGNKTATPTRAPRGELSVAEIKAIQLLEQRLSTLEINVSPLRQEIEQRFEHLNEENIEKDNVYDLVIKELEEHIEELRENSSSSIREIQENTGPIHAAIQDIQERIGPIHGAIRENRESFIPVREAIEQIRGSLTTVQAAVEQLEKRPSATPIIPSTTMANPITNGHVSSPNVDGALSGRSLDQQKLDTLGYAVGDLERRFSNIQTDELANQMVDQMKKLYPAPANLQQTIDNVNKKFKSLASQTQQALEIRDGKLDAISTRADDAKSEACAAVAKADECTSNFARLGHEVQESRTAVENLVAALPKSKLEDGTQSEAFLDVRERVHNLENDLQKWASLIQGTASRLNTVGLEKLKTDHQALKGEVSELKDEVTRLEGETARAEGEIARVEGALMSQEKQTAIDHEVIEEFASHSGYHGISWD